MSTDPRFPRFPLPRQRGVTLVELIMFMVIVAIALAGIVQVMRMTTANSADPLRRKQALMIAEALLEEVRGAGFSYCDPRSANADSAAGSGECTIAEAFGNEDPGNSPRPYDNVNDYVDVATTPKAAFNNGANVLADALGRSMNLTGYSATVSIVPDRLGDIVPADATANTDALRIRIVVKYGASDAVTLDGYRARYAPQQGIE